MRGFARWVSYLIRLLFWFIVPYYAVRGAYDAVRGVVRWDDEGDARSRRVLIDPALKKTPRLRP